ncbi:MAG TPA: DUF6378 domain-containing protein [Fimbriimonadaceae bacterium]|nr:DUF6378 domain-containing protein [Fimbriimonadaceae bacterium]
MKRGDVLDIAKNCVCRDRQDAHGNPENTFADISGLWSAYLGHPILPHEVAWMMVLFKAARAKNNPQHNDNAIDAAGYAALASELAGEPA